MMLREFSAEEYQIEGDADTVDKMVQDAKRLCGAFSALGLPFAVEVYDHLGNLVFERAEGYAPDRTP